MNHKRYIYFSFATVTEPSLITEAKYSSLLTYNQISSVEGLTQRIKDYYLQSNPSHINEEPFFDVTIKEQVLCNIIPIKKAFDDLYLKINIKTFDFVVLVSMRAIDYVKPILIDLYNSGVKLPEFIVMGKHSADNLLLLQDLFLHDNIVVHYPSTATGASAVIDELIFAKPNLFNEKNRILYVKANQEGANLHNKLRSLGFLVTECELYNYAPMSLEKDMVIKIFEYNAFDGIIITSGITLKILEQLAYQFGCLNQLRNTLFIVTHNTLADKMNKKGFINLMVV